MASDHSLLKRSEGRKARNSDVSVVYDQSLFRAQALLEKVHSFHIGIASLRDLE